MSNTLQGFEHLSATFSANEKMFPDIMEPYSIQLGEAGSAQERMEIMRRGLRLTINDRYPLAAPETVEAVPDNQGALAL